MAVPTHNSTLTTSSTWIKGLQILWDCLNQGFQMGRQRTFLLQTTGVLSQRHCPSFLMPPLAKHPWLNHLQA